MDSLNTASSVEHIAESWVRYFDFRGAGFTCEDFRTALSVFLSDDATCLNELLPVNEEMTNRLYNNPPAEQPDHDSASSLLMKSRTHTEVTTACLRYLNLSEWSSVPKRRGLERHVIQRRNEAHPFYRVAARGWIRSLDMASEPMLANNLKNEIGRLFASARSGNFQSWVCQLAGILFEEKEITEPQKRSLFVNLLHVLAKSASPMHIAACLGLDFVCKLLIEKGFDVDQKSQMGCPLYCAITGPTLLATFYGGRSVFRDPPPADDITRRRDTIKVLVDSGAKGRQDCHATEDDTPTWVALMRRGRCRGPTFGRTVLHFATYLRDLDFLHSYLAFPDSYLFDYGFGALFSDPLFPLAFRDQDPEQLSAYLNGLCTVVIDRCWKPRHRALWLAAWAKAGKHRLRCVSLVRKRPLILNDAEVAEYYDAARSCTVGEKEPSPAFYYMVRLIQDGNRPANWVTTTEGQTLLHDAVEAHVFNIVGVLLGGDKRVDISVRDSKGRTPVHFVSSEGRGADPGKMLKLLLRHGANLSSTDKDGRTVWHYAAANNDLAVLKALVDVDPDLDGSLRRTTKIGRTPLAEAFAYVRELVGHPPDPRSRSRENPNPRHMGLLFLLDHCQKDAGYLRSDIPVLCYAAEWASLNVLNRLLETHSSFELIAPNRRAALQFLNFAASKDFVRVLLGAPGMAALLEVAQKGYSPLETMFLTYNPKLRETAHPSNTVRLSVGVFDQLLTEKVRSSVDWRGRMLWERFCGDVIGRYATTPLCDDIIGKLIIVAVCSFIRRDVIRKQNGFMFTLTHSLQGKHPTPTCYWWVTKVFDVLTQFIHGCSWQELHDTCSEDFMMLGPTDEMPMPHKWTYADASSVDFTAFRSFQSVLWALRWSHASAGSSG